MYFSVNDIYMPVAVENNSGPWQENWKPVCRLITVTSLFFSVNHLEVVETLTPHSVSSVADKETTLLFLSVLSHSQICSIYIKPVISWTNINFHFRSAPSCKHWNCLSAGWDFPLCPGFLCSLFFLAAPGVQTLIPWTPCALPCPAISSQCICPNHPHPKPHPDPHQLSGREFLSASPGRQAAVSWTSSTCLYLMQFSFFQNNVLICYIPWVVCTGPLCYGSTSSSSSTHFGYFPLWITRLHWHHLIFSD